MERGPVEIYRIPRLERPSLIVSWQGQDIGKLSSRVVEFLIETLGGEEIAEIKPSAFFSFGGVRFKEDLVQVQESKFYALEKSHLLIFRSDEPEFEHYHFLDTLLSVAKIHFHMGELYTVSGTISFSAHTRPRRILAVFNQIELKKRMGGYGLEDMTWKGPPAINSYLLWVAKRKGIPGVSLWPEVPFYFGAREDYQAIQAVLSFFNRRFNLNLELNGFNAKIREQYERITYLRKENNEIDGYLTRLENGLNLDEEEQLKLVREVFEVLRG